MLVRLLAALGALISIVHSQTTCQQQPKLADFTAENRLDVSNFNLAESGFGIEVEGIYGTSFNAVDETILAIARDTSGEYWLFELAWSEQDSDLYVHYVANLDGFTSVKTITWMYDLRVALVEEATNIVHIIELGETSRPLVVDESSPFGGSSSGTISRTDDGVVVESILMNIATQHAQLGVEAVAYSGNRDSFVAVLEKHDMRVFEVDYGHIAGTAGNAHVLESFNSMFLMWDEENNRDGSELVSISNLAGVYLDETTHDLFVSSSESKLFLRLVVAPFYTGYKVVEQVSMELLREQGFGDVGTEGISLANFSSNGLYGFVATGNTNITVSFADCDLVNSRSIRSDVCNNNALDGYETDIDCGGVHCEPCPMDKRCDSGRDCETAYCAIIDGTNNFCTTPPPTLAPTRSPDFSMGPPDEEDEEDAHTLPPTPKPTDYWEGQQTPCDYWHECPSGACMSPGRCVPATSQEVMCSMDTECDYTELCDNGFCASRQPKNQRCSGPEMCSTGFCYLGECLEDNRGEEGNQEGGDGNEDGDDDDALEPGEDPESDEKFQPPGSDDEADQSTTSPTPTDGVDSANPDDPSNQEGQRGDTNNQVGMPVETFTTITTLLGVGLLVIGVVYFRNARVRRIIKQQRAEKIMTVNSLDSQSGVAIQSVVPLEVQV